MTTLITLILIFGFWVTNKHIKRTENKMVTSIQDFKNQADSINLGQQQKLDSINAKIIALKDLIVAGGGPTPAQLQLLDDVITASQANLDQSGVIDSNANPPTP